MKTINPAKTRFMPQIVGYLALLTLIAGDTMFAEDYIRPTFVWIIWLGLALVTLVGAARYFFSSDWKRVFKQMPIELVLLLALMIGSAPWSAYAADTVSGFAIQL
ncbi:MAG: hypothetical protein EBR26_06620, partial [Microbacteriaceae bacterium]|nr:hypothetical protein [Microbacteriaceae bacterium]